jgi:hypothetical protein
MPVTIGRRELMAALDGAHERHADHAGVARLLGDTSRR